MVCESSLELIMIASLFPEVMPPSLWFGTMYFHYFIWTFLNFLFSTNQMIKSNTMINNNFETAAFIYWLHLDRFSKKQRKSTVTTIISSNNHTKFWNRIGILLLGKIQSLGPSFSHVVCSQHLFIISFLTFLSKDHYQGTHANSLNGSTKF